MKQSITGLLLLLNVAISESSMSQVKVSRSYLPYQQHSVYKIPDIEPEYDFVQIMNYEIALDSLNLLIKNDVDNRDLIYYRAWCHFIHEQYYFADVDIANYLQNHPNTKLYNSYVLQGNIHAKRMAYKFALEAYDKAIALNINNPLAYIEKANIYVGSKNYVEGIRFLNKSIEVFPNHTVFLVSRASMYTDTNVLKKAYKDFQTILSRIDTLSTDLSSSTYFAYGRYYYLKKDYKNAIQQVEIGLKINDLITAYGFLGELKYLNEDYDGALSAFNTFIDRGAANSKYYLMIAEMYETKGNYPMACKFYNYQLDMYSDDIKAQKKLKKLNCISKNQN